MDFLVKVLPRANHSMLSCHHRLDDRSLLNEMAPEYYATMFEWLRPVVRAP